MYDLNDEYLEDNIYCSVDALDVYADVMN